MMINQRHKSFNPLNAKLNPICHLLAMLGAHPILHVSWIRVKQKSFLLRLLIYLRRKSKIRAIQLKSM
jgi:hypothetical protein